MKTTTTVVAVIGMALAGSAAWWWQNRASTATPVAQAPVAQTSPPAARAASGAAMPGAGVGGQAGPAPVEVARAEALTLSDDVQTVGSLKSRQGVMLRPETSGRVSRLGFADGQRVQRGQLLVQLDDSLQQAQLLQAQAQMSIARSNLQRSRELLAQNFVSQSAVEQNQSAMQVADAQVALAQAQLARMKVLAPFDGTVGIRSVQLGDYVKDGADLVGLEDLSALHVEFTLPERYIARVRSGQPVEIALDALPGRVFQGRIEALDSQVDPNGRSLRVRAAVDNAGALLKPGMFARPRVVFALREGAVVVPEEALVPLGGKQLIFKVAQGADGKPVSQRLEAKLGLRLPGKVEVLQGLQHGDQVVTAGHGRLLRGDGHALRVVDLSAPVGARPATGASAPAPGASSPSPAPVARVAAQP
jgi:membrane fusion protein (multidrug efflux system)